MNRADRRKKGLKAKTYTLTDEQITRMKKNAVNEAMSVAFTLMLGIPVMVLHDKYGWGGKKRLPDFMDYVLDLYDSFNKGYLTLDDIRQTIEEETGVVLSQARKEFI